MLGLFEPFDLESIRLLTELYLNGDPDGVEKFRLAMIERGYAICERCDGFDTPQQTQDIDGRRTCKLCRIELDISG